MNMQKLFLVGRATRDAESQESKGGKDYARFGLAVNRYLGKEKGEEVTFYECVTFGEKSTTKAHDRIKKGDLMILEGRPEAEAYQTKEGELKAVLKVIVDDWQVLK